MLSFSKAMFSAKSCWKLSFPISARTRPTRCACGRIRTNSRCITTSRDQNPVASGQLVQVSVSRGGIPKVAIPEGIVTALGLEGDGHEHPDIHGGPDRALLLVTAEGIEELAANGYALAYGSLGENLTARGIARSEWRV